MQETSLTEEPLTLAVISVDSPRTTFDIHGVESKNAVLRRIGSLMSNALRSTDIIARWGICEFAALFPGEDQFGGACAVEKIVRAVRAERFVSTSGDEMTVTLSAGVTPVSAGTSIDDAMSNADRYLFQATAAGGDRVVSSQSEAPARIQRVLLLIHDALTSQVLIHLFERDGFEVTHIKQVDGPLAPDLGPHKLHLIVIDEGIPHRGGFDVLQELRALRRNSRTPMVMLIAKNSTDSMTRSLELGANDYMMRPFSPFTFIRRMRRLLKKGMGDIRPHAEGEICRILVIDGEPRSLLVAAPALHERGGFRPFLAKGPEDGRKRLAETLPDVVLLDVDMEEPGAGRFVAELLSESDPDRLSLILTTATKDDSELKQFSGSALRGMIRKPFDALSLGKQIEEALHMSPNSRHADDAGAHLSTELQRIMQTSPTSEG